MLPLDCPFDSEFFDMFECREISDLRVRREVLDAADFWDKAPVACAEFWGWVVGILVCIVAVIGRREDWGWGVGRWSAGGLARIMGRVRGWVFGKTLAKMSVMGLE
jgi:hypothetical protein